jgi:hypothetical protein
MILTVIWELNLCLIIQNRKGSRLDVQLFCDGAEFNKNFGLVQLCWKAWKC